MKLVSPPRHSHWNGHTGRQGLSGPRPTGQTSAVALCSRASPESRLQIQKKKKKQLIRARLGRSGSAVAVSWCTLLWSRWNRPARRTNRWSPRPLSVSERSAECRTHTPVRPQFLFSRCTPLRSPAPWNQPEHSLYSGKGQVCYITSLFPTVKIGRTRLGVYLLEFFTFKILLSIDGHKKKLPLSWKAGELSLWSCGLCFEWLIDCIIHVISLDLTKVHK